MNNDERAVFYSIANCEIGTYMSTYAPERCVVSAIDIAHMHSWTKYRARKAVNGLVQKGMIERVSIGNPAIISCGEYEELVCESAPPTNGYAITDKGFKSKEWESIYSKWEKSMGDMVGDIR